LIAIDNFDCLMGVHCFASCCSATMARMIQPTRVRPAGT
jgi:hypothetical protein